MFNKLRLQIVILGIFGIISLSHAEDTKTEKLQEINTETNLRNNSLYERNTEFNRTNTDINIQNRVEHLDDRCIEARRKIRAKEDEISFSIRSRNENLEKKARLELEILRSQEAQYCNE